MKDRKFISNEIESLYSKLAEDLKPFGQISCMRVKIHHDYNQPYAFVCFGSQIEAQ